MKRFLLAALFFAVLLLIWEAMFRAKIWSPVLLPSPRQVAVYLEGAAVDGTLVKATIVTMRRLLIGYIIGLVVGLPLGLLTARWKVWQDTIRGNNGHALVRRHRNGNWRAQRAANLQSCRFDHGLQASAHVVQGNPARGASVYR